MCTTCALKLCVLHSSHPNHIKPLKNVYISSLLNPQCPDQGLAWSRDLTEISWRPPPSNLIYQNTNKEDAFQQNTINIQNFTSKIKHKSHWAILPAVKTLSSRSSGTVIINKSLLNTYKCLFNIVTQYTFSSPSQWDLATHRNCNSPPGRPAFVSVTETIQRYKCHTWLGHFSRINKQKGARSVTCPSTRSKSYHLFLEPW